PVSAPTEAPQLNLVSVAPGVVNIEFRTQGSGSPRARDPKAIGVQISVVNGANPVADGEADAGSQVYASRSPGQLNSTTWPANVRLYARWVTQRGLTSPWSAAIVVAKNR